MDVPNRSLYFFIRSMACMTLLNVPAPLLASFSFSKPSRLMDGTKFPTRSISLQKSSSISVPFVKQWNALSLCFSQSRITSALRTSGSPPVSRNAWIPSSSAWVHMLSISSKLRFSRFPYSAAQQPVQCRLHALVGSSNNTHGMEQPYFSAFFLAILNPRKPAS